MRNAAAHDARAHHGDAFHRTHLGFSRHVRRDPRELFRALLEEEDADEIPTSLGGAEFQNRIPFQSQ